MRREYLDWTISIAPLSGFVGGVLYLNDHEIGGLAILMLALLANFMLAGLYYGYGRKDGATAAAAERFIPNTVAPLTFPAVAAYQSKERKP